MFDRVALAKKHGSSAILQGRINDEWVLFWVYKWGWTSNQIIQRLLQVVRSRPADDFVKKGLLTKIETPAGHPENHVYILSETGYTKASIMDEQSNPNSKNHYQLHNSKRVPFSLNSHNLLAQHIALDMLGPIDKSKPPGEWNYKRLMTDYEIQATDDKKDDIPDFIILFTSENGLIQKRHVEIELNQKTKVKLHKWLYPRVKKSNAKHKTESLEFATLVLTPFDSIIKSYCEALKKKVSRAIKVSDGYALHPTAFTTLEYPNIMFSKLTKDPIRKSGGFSFLDWKTATMVSASYEGIDE